MTTYKFDMYSSHPRGGMKPTITETGVKVTHEPTGIFAVCECERSQHRNKEVALQMVKQGVRALQGGVVTTGWKRYDDWHAADGDCLFVYFTLDNEYYCADYSSPLCDGFLEPDGMRCYYLPINFNTLTPLLKEDAPCK